MQAVALTFGTLVALLLAYRSGMIRVTDKFRLGVVAATGGIALFYVVSMIMGFSVSGYFHRSLGQAPWESESAWLIVIVAA